jgi:hypothetical protein
VAAIRERYYAYLATVYSTHQISLTAHTMGFTDAEGQPIVFGTKPTAASRLLRRCGDVEASTDNAVAVPFERRHLEAWAATVGDRSALLQLTFDEKVQSLKLCISVEACLREGHAMALPGMAYREDGTQMACWWHCERYTCL